MAEKKNINKNLKKRNVVQKSLTEEDVKLLNEMELKEAEKLSEMRREYKKVTERLANGEIPSRQDLQLALDLRKEDRSEGKNSVKSTDLLYMATTVKDPVLVLETAKEIKHHPELQKIVFRDPKVNSDYASQISGANLRVAGKFACREFVRTPSESNLLALVRIANTSGSDFERLAAIVAKYGTEDQKRMFADKVDRLSDEDMEKINDKINGSIVKEAKKELKKEQQLGWDFTARYVCDAKDEKGLLEHLADMIFGTDDEILKMSKSARPSKQHKAEELRSGKMSFLHNTEKSINSIKLAKSEAGKNQKFIEENNKLVESEIAREFDEFVQAQIAPYQSVLDGIRRMYPDEAAYQGYLNSLRNTSAYKKAYTKYDKMFKEKRAELEITVPTKLRKDMENSAKVEARNSYTKKSSLVKESNKEMVLGEEE